MFQDAVMLYPVINWVVAVEEQLLRPSSLPLTVEVNVYCRPFNNIISFPSDKVKRPPTGTTFVKVTFSSLVVSGSVKVMMVSSPVSSAGTVPMFLIKYLRVTV